MTRLLNVWRSWSPRRRLITVGVATLAVAGAGVAAYEILKRPGDISNPDATFVETPEKKKVVKTVNWPIYGYDDERTRYLASKRVKPPFGDSEWSFVAGKLLEFSPIIADGTLYLIDKDGLVLAINAKSGQVSTGGAVKGGAALHKGTVYVGNYAGELYAIDASNGDVRWQNGTQGGS